jgi:alkylation response protein AidB-like acyl-CoA dehydrogenase
MDWLTVEQWLQAVIAPQAEKIDQNPQALAAAFQGLGDRHLLALKRPSTEVGPLCDSLQFWRFQRALARASGSLAFLQLQHQSAVAFLCESPNHALVNPLLPQLADGRVRIGVAFSQLRRGNSLTATPLTEGWGLTGHLPWATGFSLFDHLIVGAHLPDQQILLCLLPFRDQGVSGEGLSFSAPLALAAMGVTQTVSARFNEVFITPEQVVEIHAATWLQERDRRNVLAPTAGLMGCTQAALDQLKLSNREGGTNKVLPCLHRQWQRLTRQIEAQLALPCVDYDAALKLRAQAVSLAFRSTQTGVVACGGAANGLSHPAQRLYREALAWAVLGQTLRVREACLAASASV